MIPDLNRASLELSNQRSWKRQEIEGLISKLQQLAVLQSQGAENADASRQIRVTEQTSHKLREFVIGMQTQDLTPLEELEIKKLKRRARSRGS